jgi:hypothetical protein
MAAQIGHHWRQEVNLVFLSTVVPSTNVRAPYRIPSSDTRPIEKTPHDSHAILTTPSPGNPASRTASDLLLQVLQGSAIDLGSDANRASDKFFSSPASSGAAQCGSTNKLQDSPGGLASRSIWSSGLGGLSTPVQQAGIQQRPGSGQQTRMHQQTASAEALFNSMPNQNQNTGSNRSSPNMGATALYDPSKRNIFTNAEAPVAPFNAQSDIWNAPMPRGPVTPDSRMAHAALRAPYQQPTRQYG